MLEIDLKPDLAKQLAEWATRKGQTVDALVADAISQLLDDLDDIQQPTRRCATMTRPRTSAWKK